MDRHEIKARIDAQIDEWYRSIDALKARGEAATGTAKADYLKQASEYQTELDGLKIEAAKVWDVADDAWDSAGKDLQLKWDEWQLRARNAWSDLSE